MILFLGYTSSSVWGRLFPKKAVVISNMDGMEWKRSKYPGWVQKFLLYAEKLAVRYSHHLVADSSAIREYLDKKYKTRSSYIPYGAEITGEVNEGLLKNYGLVKREYYMLMARMEPENNIDMILEGFCKTGSARQFIVVGNINNSFGKKMHAKYGTDKRVHFTGAIFGKAVVSALRRYCELYFHGHSVGGTNPSLLEAMAGEAVIAAHNNEFNRAVLHNDGFYFNTAGEVTQLIDAISHSEKTKEMQYNNLKRIKEQFSWPVIIDQYEAMIISCYNASVK